MLRLRTRRNEMDDIGVIHPLPAGIFDILEDVALTPQDHVVKEVTLYVKANKGESSTSERDEGLLQMVRQQEQNNSTSCTMESQTEQSRDDEADSAVWHGRSPAEPKDTTNAIPQGIACIEVKYT